MEHSFGRGFDVKKEEEDEDEYGYPHPIQVLGGQRFSMDGRLRGEMKRDLATASAEVSYTARAKLPAGNVQRQNVNNDGGAHGQQVPVGIKTLKYAGKSDWEVFHAQFELLACANSWLDEQKALQLALCTVLPAASRPE